MPFSKNTRRVLLPGSTIGIMGSGQLGRMLALAAHRLGYRTCVLSPTKNSPAGEVANCEIVGDYHDHQTLTKFAAAVNCVTYEFENLPFESLEWLAKTHTIFPSPRALFTFQNRLREKTFLRDLGLRVPEFREVSSAAELTEALQHLGLPAVLKTAGFGYDGKGQLKIETLAEAAGIAHLWDGKRYIVERFVKFRREVSMVAARGQDGAFAHYGLIENSHSKHILDYSIAPSHSSSESLAQAQLATRTIFESLGVVGIMCVEFFEIEDGELLINEVAPRTHNSGHLTIDACETSQFEQQLRAVCGLPLGSTGFLSPAAMVNLLGDLWSKGEPNWSAVMAESARLHLYGKEAAKEGRKMGHITVLASTPDTALKQALSLRQKLMRAGH